MRDITNIHVVPATAFCKFNFIIAAAVDIALTNVATKMLSHFVELTKVVIMSMLYAILNELI